MSGITHEEINIICDSDNNIAIFDCDYWEEGKQESQKNIKN